MEKAGLEVKLGQLQVTNGTNEPITLSPTAVKRVMKNIKTYIVGTESKAGEKSGKKFVRAKW